MMNTQLSRLISLLSPYIVSGRPIVEVLIMQVDPDQFDGGSLANEMVGVYETQKDDPLLPQLFESIAIWMLSWEKADATENGIKVLQYLSAQKIPSAIFNLAMEYIKGTSIRADHELANRMLKQALAAERGNNRLRSMILTVMADSHRDGRGCVQDREAAHKIYCEAAELGSADAAFNAGLMFDSKDPNVLPKDLARAAHYYELGMNLSGEAAVHCRTNLGVLHMGLAFPGANYERGRQLLLVSHAMGDAKAKSAIDMFDALWVGARYTKRNI